MTDSNTRNESIPVDTSSVMIADLVPKSTKRTQLIVINTSTTAKITIVKSDQAAVAGAGIVLNPSGSFAESTDSGYKCYQGKMSAISDVAGGTISIVESYED